jgi:hypothetical protein
MSGAKYLGTRRAGRILLDAEALDGGWIAPEKQLSCEPPFGSWSASISKVWVSRIETRVDAAFGCSPARRRRPISACPS